MVQTVITHTHRTLPTLRTRLTHRTHRIIRTIRVANYLDSGEKTSPESLSTLRVNIVLIVIIR